MTEADMLTACEVAQILRVDVETVRRWVRCNEIPYVKISARVIRFRRDVLDDWMAERSGGDGD